MDYKEKYEQALERARQFSEKPYLEDSAGIVEYIFPELAESEDERIRKALIEYFNEQCDMSDWNGVYGYQVVAWLEKQGKKTEQNPKCKEVKDLEAAILAAHPTFKQKPAWSEEDEKKRKCLIKGLEDRMGFGWASDPFSREEYIDWLKSLKDKVLPQLRQE